MLNPTHKDKIVAMDEPLPDSEDERTREALHLCDLISRDDYSQLTSWELQTIQDVKNGKAATKVRLREIRQAVKRLQKSKK